MRPSAECASGPAAELGQVANLDQSDHRRAGSGKYTWAMEAEGWYHDPYQRHEARWFSDGRATDLVRDGTQVTHDAPPDGAFRIPRTPWSGPVDESGDDLRRADSAQDGGTVDGHTVASKVARVVFNPGDTEYW